MQLNNIVNMKASNKLRFILGLISRLGLSAIFALSASFSGAAELDAELSADRGVAVGVDSGLNVDSLLQVLIALISVICIIFILSVLVKKFNILPGGSSGLIKIISGISLTSKDRLLLIQVGDEQILVSTSPSGINKIHELGTAVVPEAISSVENHKAGSFSSLLNSVISRPRP